MHSGTKSVFGLCAATLAFSQRLHKSRNFNSTGNWKVNEMIGGDLLEKAVRKLVSGSP